MKDRYVVCVGHYPRCECTGVTNAIARAFELYREPLSGAAFNPVTIYNHATGTFIVVRANGTLVCE